MFHLEAGRNAQLRAGGLLHDIGIVRDGLGLIRRRKIGHGDLMPDARRVRGPIGVDRGFSGESGLRGGVIESAEKQDGNKNGRRGEESL